VLFERREKHYLFCLLFFATTLIGQSGSIDKALQLFVEYEQAGVVDHEDSIETIFDACELDSIRSSKDIARAVIFKTKKTAIRAKKFKEQSIGKRDALKRFRLHIRKHKYAYDIIAHSRTLKKRYKHAFNNEYIVEDVYKRPDLYDYSPRRGDHLVKFFKLLQHDLGAISRFETKLHSRYGRLKSLNYSLKIKCVKVRNEILFHPWYKHRLRSAHELVADAFGPLTFMGKVLFHVVPSVFCILGLTLSTSLGGSHPNQD
jgi:hypothetical protein